MTPGSQGTRGDHGTHEPGAPGGGHGPSNSREVLEAVAAQVQAALDRLAPHHTLPRTPEEGTLWHQLQTAIIDAYVARAQEQGSRGGRAVIMAGSPGAGKSQATSIAAQALGPHRSREVGIDGAGWTTIDADDVKQLLLGTPVAGLEVDPALLARARNHWEDLITTHAPGPLADARPLLRGELATLVHPLSTTTADLVRKELLRKRFDVRIEGTLQWEGQGPRLVSELEAADYAQVTIIAVDTPQDLCLAGAWHRWALPRSRGEPTARYTPPTAVTTTFTTGPDGTPTSRCTTNARTTHQLATTSTTLTTTSLVTLHRTPHGPTRLTLTTPTPPDQAPAHQAPAPTQQAPAHPTRPPTPDDVLRAITQPPTTPPAPRPDPPHHNHRHHKHLHH